MVIKSALSSIYLNLHFKADERKEKGLIKLNLNKLMK